MCVRVGWCVGGVTSAQVHATRDFRNERLTGSTGASLPWVVLVPAEPVIVALPDTAVVGGEDDEGLLQARAWQRRACRRAGEQASRRAIVSQLLQQLVPTPPAAAGD